QKDDRGITLLDPWLGGTEQSPVIRPCARRVGCRAPSVGTALPGHPDLLEHRAHHCGGLWSRGQRAIEGHVEWFVDRVLERLDVALNERALDPFRLTQPEIGRHPVPE